MQCPRCSEQLQNVVEYINENNDEGFLYVRQYYCTNCKSGLTENFNNIGLFRSEWIDFNV